MKREGGENTLCTTHQKQHSQKKRPILKGKKVRKRKKARKTKRRGWKERQIFYNVYKKKKKTEGREERSKWTREREKGKKLNHEQRELDTRRIPSLQTIRKCTFCGSDKDTLAWRRGFRGGTLQSR